MIQFSYRKSDNDEREIMQNITTQKALEAIDFIACSDASDVLPTQAVEIATYAVSQDVQIRDYFLGLPLEHTLEALIPLCEKLLPLTDQRHLHAIYTLYSAFLYESGDKDRAFLALTEAQQLSPDYSLATLLKRIYEAGWPGAGLATMRKELHPKVVESLNERLDKVLA